MLKALGASLRGIASESNATTSPNFAGKESLRLSRIARTAATRKGTMVARTIAKERVRAERRNERLFPRSMYTPRHTKSATAAGGERIPAMSTRYLVNLATDLQPQERGSIYHRACSFATLRSSFDDASGEKFAAFTAHEGLAQHVAPYDARVA